MMRVKELQRLESAGAGNMAATLTPMPRSALLAAAVLMLLPVGDAACIRAFNPCHGQNDQCEEGYTCHVSSASTGTGHCRLATTHHHQHCSQGGNCPPGMDCRDRSNDCEVTMHTPLQFDVIMTVQAA